MSIEGITKALSLASLFALIAATVSVVLAVASEGETAVKWALVAIAWALISKVSLE